MSNRNISQDDKRAIARIVNELLESETDQGHVDAIQNSYKKFSSLWDVEAKDGEVSEEDVRVALDYLRNDYPHLYEFVDVEARYTNGMFPDPRDWTVDYVQDSDVIESRIYDFDDEIPTEPVIDGEQYYCDRTERGDGHVVVYVLDFDPSETNWSANCHDCDYREYFEDEEAAMRAVNEHEDETSGDHMVVRMEGKPLF